MQSVFDVGEHWTTDEGIRVQVIEILSCWQARVRRMDTGELTVATAERRTFPKAERGGSVSRLEPKDVEWNP